MNSSFLRGFVRLTWMAGWLGCLVNGAAAATPLPAALVAKSDLTKLVGREVSEPKTMPEDMDDELGAKQTVSFYSAGNLRILVSVHRFPSAKDAVTKLTQAKVAALVDEENPKGTKVTEESGVGDRAFWATSEHGASFTVVKGANALTLAVFGQLPQPVASYHDSLRSLAATAVAKL